MAISHEEALEKNPLVDLNLNKITSTPELPTLGKYKILVVEDDPSQRELLLLHIGRWGLNGIGAGDGRQGLSLLRSDDSIRLLITDLNMPGVDGLELLRQIQGTCSQKLYSIVLSGIRDRATLVNTLKAGATDYLFKPCHPEQLFARLAALDKIMALEEGHRALVKDLFDVMGEMLGSRDNYTSLHCLRVAALSRRTAKVLGFSSDELEVLELGCLVHDIGKIAIPDDVLLKPGKFDKKDRRIMNMHPVIGAGFLASRYPDDRLIEIILYHHERLDGSGYPSGLKGDEIPPLVRIVAVADIYEALVAKRPYKTPFGKEKALQILGEEAEEGRLDAGVVKAIEKVLEGFDPLSIQKHMRQDARELEAFRRFAYFREPLCSFYNYRYLLAMDSGLVSYAASGGYSLLLIDFVNLKGLNRSLGYLKADQILDEFGETIQSYLADFNRVYAGVQGDAIICRKGADYLVYFSYPKEFWHEVQSRICKVLEGFRSAWGLDAKVIERSFKHHCPLEDALDKMFYKDLG